MLIYARGVVDATIYKVTIVIRRSIYDVCNLVRNNTKKHEPTYKIFFHTYDVRDIIIKLLSLSNNITIISHVSSVSTIILVFTTSVSFTKLIVREDAGQTIEQSVLQLLCVACVVALRVTDDESRRVFHYLRNRSREWSLLNNVTWGSIGTCDSQTTSLR